jgi:hypothetical protein
MLRPLAVFKYQVSRCNFYLEFVSYFISWSHYRLIFISTKWCKYITTTRKSILKLVKLQSLVAKCCKMRKIQPYKFLKFCINTFVLRAELATIFVCSIQIKSIQNLRTLQGYIFSILQHFATKLCNSILIIVCSF